MAAPGKPGKLGKLGTFHGASVSPVWKPLGKGNTFLDVLVSCLFLVVQLPVVFILPHLQLPDVNDITIESKQKIRAGSSFILFLF